MIIQGKWTLTDKGRVAVLQGRLEDAQKAREGLYSQVLKYDIDPQALDVPEDDLWILSELDELDEKINQLEQELDTLTPALQSQVG